MEGIPDDPCPGHPSTSKTDENAQNVAWIVREDGFQNIWVFDPISNFDKEAVR